MSMDSITEVFYHLNKMLIATNTLRTIILSFSEYELRDKRNLVATA